MDNNYEQNYNYDEFNYVQQPVNHSANEETLPLYSKIIESKDHFNVRKDDESIARVSKKSLGTILEMIQEYIEETVLWIYHDPHDYDKIEDIISPQAVPFSNLVNERQIYKGSFHEENIEEDKQIENTEVKERVPSNKSYHEEPRKYNILMIIYISILLFATILVAHHFIINELDFSIYFLFVVIDVPLLYITGVIGLFIIFAAKNKSMTSASFLLMISIGLSVLILVIQYLTNFSEFDTFINFFHVPLAIICIIALIFNSSFQKQHETTNKSDLEVPLLANES